MNMIEIWKDIKDWEGLYQVSNLARVRSVERVVQFGNQKRLVKSQILKQTLTKNGYLSVMLCNGKITKRCYIHRLVAEAFKPNPYNKPEIDHINRIKTDNRIENLRWVDRPEQLENRDISKYTKPVIQLTLNNEFVNKFDSISEASRQTGINDESIRQCYHGKRKSAGGYRWIKFILPSLLFHHQQGCCSRLSRLPTQYGTVQFQCSLYQTLFQNNL